MADMTVSKLATTIGTTVDKLLDQLKEAGVSVKDKDAQITDAEKRQLLTYLRKSGGSATSNGNTDKKITLKRKSLSTLKVGKSASQKKTVQIEVRKKKTYVHHKVILEEQKKKREEEAAKLEALKIEQEKKQQQKAKEKPKKIPSKKVQPKTTELDTKTESKLPEKSKATVTEQEKK
jgi:translation initiation factor IF-2